MSGKTSSGKQIRSKHPLPLLRVLVRVETAVWRTGRPEVECTHRRRHAGCCWLLLDGPKDTPATVLLSSARHQIIEGIAVD